MLTKTLDYPIHEEFFPKSFRATITPFENDPSYTKQIQLRHRYIVYDLSFVSDEAQAWMEDFRKKFNAVSRPRTFHTHKRCRMYAWYFQQQSNQEHAIGFIPTAYNYFLPHHVDIPLPNQINYFDLDAERIKLDKFTTAIRDNLSLPVITTYWTFDYWKDELIPIHEWYKIRRGEHIARYHFLSRDDALIAKLAYYEDD